MSRTIELRLGTVVAVAELLDDVAPQTCRRLWDTLPIEGTMRNLRWGGNATYLVDDRLVDRALPVENRVTWHVRGTLLFRPEWGEIIVPYGPSQARGPRTVATWDTVFARLGANADALLALAGRLVHEGAQPLAIGRGRS